MIDHFPPAPGESVAIRKRSRAIIITLLFPTMAIILSSSMFGVALPTIRDEFVMTADVAAWLTIAFSLPFMMLMPLYGRLGDELSRSRLLIMGLVLFSSGVILTLFARSLPQLFLGRMIQGAGASGVTPLSLAIIAQRFSPEERGRALGTWNSVAPGTSIFAPSVGGFLVDAFGWRMIFIPILLVGLFAIFIMRWQIPPLRDKSNWAVLRHFDWRGVLLMSGAITTLVLYVSSRPVTGVEPLQDWRLLLGVLLFGTTFVRWERRQSHPLVDLAILRNRSFRIASLSAGLRMSMMIGIGFLAPLYLTDLYGLSASTIGLLASVHSTALFLVIRFGSSLADRWLNRWLITGSLSLQTLMMAYFAWLPAGRPLLWFAAGALVHGLGAGFSLAALHRTALSSVDPARTGAAAGLYSMTRFSGSMLATAIAGVLLQNGLDRGLSTLQAYQLVYAFLAGVGLLGILLASQLQE